MERESDGERREREIKTRDGEQEKLREYKKRESVGE